MKICKLKCLKIIKLFQNILSQAPLFVRYPRGSGSLRQGPSAAWRSLRSLAACSVMRRGRRAPQGLSGAPSRRPPPRRCPCRRVGRPPRRQPEEEDEAGRGWPRLSEARPCPVKQRWRGGAGPRVAFYRLAPADNAPQSAGLGGALLGLPAV